MTVERYNDLAKRAADMRLALARGTAVDAQDFDSLAAEAHALAVTARIGTLEHQLQQLMARADAADYTTDKYEGGLPTIRALPDALRPRLTKWREDLRKAIEPGQPAAKKAQRVSAIDQAIQTFGRTTQLETWIPYAGKRIADKELHDLLASIALQIGIFIVTDQLASAALSALRAYAIARGPVTASRTTSLLFKTRALLDDVRRFMRRGVQIR